MRSFSLSPSFSLCLTLSLRHFSCLSLFSFSHHAPRHLPKTHLATWRVAKSNFNLAMRKGTEIKRMRRRPLWILTNSAGYSPWITNVPKCHMFILPYIGTIYSYMPVHCRSSIKRSLLTSFIDRFSGGQ